MLNRIKENSTLRSIWKWTRRVHTAIGFALTLSFITFLVLIANTKPVAPQVDPVVRIHEQELSHRIQICSQAIDAMSPQFSDAGFHCSMMWLEMKKIEAYMEKNNQKPDIEMKHLIMQTFNTAARYAEYQAAVNRPIFRPTPSPDQ